MRPSAISPSWCGQSVTSDSATDTMATSVATSAAQPTHCMRRRSTTPAADVVGVGDGSGQQRGGPQHDDRPDHDVVAVGEQGKPGRQRRSRTPAMTNARCPALARRPSGSVISRWNSSAGVSVSASRWPTSAASAADAVQLPGAVEAPGERTDRGRRRERMHDRSGRAVLANGDDHARHRPRDRQARQHDEARGGIAAGGDEGRGRDHRGCDADEQAEPSRRR